MASLPRIDPPLPLITGPQLRVFVFYERGGRAGGQKIAIETEPKGAHYAAMKRSLLAFLICALCPLAFAGNASLPTARVYYLATGSPAAGTNEVQTITFGSGQSSGVFYLRFNNSTTSAIIWSATNNTLRDNIDAALESLSRIGTGGVTTAVGSMTAGIGTITVTFSSALANTDVPQMTVPTKTTSGTIAVTTTTPGVAADGKNAPNGSLLVIGDSTAVYKNTGSPPNPVWTEIISP